MCARAHAYMYVQVKFNTHYSIYMQYEKAMDQEISLYHTLLLSKMCKHLGTSIMEHFMNILIALPGETA